MDRVFLSIETILVFMERSGAMGRSSLSLLYLLQLADSGLPIGTTAHSFGLETLTAEATLTAPDLPGFLRDYLQEVGRQEAAHCRIAHRLVDGEQDRFRLEWVALNDRLSALRPARESRAASGTLGRRMLQLVLTLEERPLLRAALQAVGEARTEVHQCTAFGLAGGLLGFEEDETVLSYLHQSMMGLVSACQRLLPLGQNGAARLLWDLKPDLIAAMEGSRDVALDDVICFTPLLDLGGMRHPDLPTRLFIS